MSLLISIAILAAIVFAAYTGSKRGFVLIGLELISFVIATGLALAVYRPGGILLKNVAHISASLSNVITFVVLWGVIEVGCALFIRFYVLRRIISRAPLSSTARIGGSVINALKTAAIITLGLAVFMGLQLASSVKRPVNESFVARYLLAASGNLQSTLARGLGRDLTDSLTFFTVTADTEESTPPLMPT